MWSKMFTKVRWSPVIRRDALRNNPKSAGPKRARNKTNQIEHEPTPNVERSTPNAELKDAFVHCAPSFGVRRSVLDVGRSTFALGDRRLLWQLHRSFELRRFFFDAKTV